MRAPRASSIGSIAEEKKENRETKHFSVSQLFHELVDTSALQDKPYLLLNCGLLAGYMGIYIILYYINLYALERTAITTSLASYILVILNATSTVGRIAPSALADRIGATHVLGVTTLISALLVFCLLAVNNSPGLVIWAVVFGAAAGAFMALPAAGVVSVSAQRTRIGARLGMTLGIVGCGVLVAEPIAGAILRGNGRWAGLVGWCGGLLVLGALSLGGARLSKVGWRFREVV
jgi:predicted MFS family arabinose efflux permease